MSDESPTLPFVSISNTEIADGIPYTEGDAIFCPNGCEVTHTIEHSNPPKLLVYTCKDDTYLVGMDGVYIKRFYPSQRSNI